MDYSKIKKNEKSEQKPKNPDEVTEAIVKVSLASYVPPSIKVRSRIDEFMFTAEMTQRQLTLIETDKQVVSVQASEKIRVIEPVEISKEKKPSTEQSDREGEKRPAKTTKSSE